MDKPGYTPGPWHVVPYGDGNALVICTEPDGNWRICFLATPGDSSGAWETIKADARLIAAAPDLVEAMARLITAAKMLLANAEGCAANHYGNDMELHGPPGWLADCANDIESARAALSAALKEPSNG